MRKISLEQTVSWLIEHDNIEILTHDNPDGDTVGSAYALCMALQDLGKNTRVLTPCAVPVKFRAFGEKIKAQDFTAEYVVSVDVAALSLLGSLEKNYAEHIDLCIDHHGSNSVPAESTYLDPSAAAVGEMMFEIIKNLGVEMTKEIASAIYLAVSTDTGCFRYSNTTSRTLRICAELLELGVENGEINYMIFDQKSREKVLLERRVYETLTYFCGGKGAMIAITNDMLHELGTDDSETEGLASIPRQIEGVLIGMTIREKEDGCFKISVRTNGKVNACNFCMKFGGGGHPAAAGCTVSGTLEEVKEKLIKAAEEFL